MSRELLHANDIRFVEVATTLTDTDWAQPSLCAGWTNHDVLAHLVFGYLGSPAAVAVEMARRSGSFDRANAELARDLSARRSPGQLLDDYADGIRSPRGLGRVFPRRLLLGDHVIHELDIVFALDRPSSVGVDQLAAVLNTQVRVPNPFIPARSRAAGLLLDADDIGWRHGVRGPHVTGSGAHLASALAGRRWALTQLRGDGVGVLRSRI